MNGNAHHHQPLLPTAIPLHCNICPKKPDFSDVSHLLTHVASKGHLSHYYKAKVRADHDVLSKQIVDEYDEWYEEWNVQDLMRERMNQKERNKGGASSAARSANGSRRASAANSTVTTARNTPMPAPLPIRRPYPFRESTLDPQLDRVIKQEPKSRSTTPAGSFLDPAAISRQFAPPMQMWTNATYVDSPMTQDTNPLDSIYGTPTTDSLEEEEEDLPVQPAPRRSRRRRNPSGSNQSNAAAEDVDADGGDGKPFELKGQHLPGMGRFDAATQDGKRKRNQKKAPDVLSRLKAISLQIEPIELVFMEGELARERPITGNPEEDDGLGLLPGESEPEVETQPKKKVVRKPRTQNRTALAERNVNNGRITRRRQDAHHPASGMRQTPYFNSDGTDDEYTFGTLRRSNIHLDNSGPEITFENQASMHTLTSRFPNSEMNFSLQPRPPMVIQNGFIRGHGRQHSSQGSGVFRPAPNNSLAPPFHAPQHLASFGHLTGGQSMFQNSNFGSAPAPVSTGQQALGAFENQFASNMSQFGQGSNMHPNLSNSSSYMTNGTDPFVSSFGNPDLGMSAFNPGFSMNDANPLFYGFGSGNGAQEDDEATVSPPSEH